LNIDASKIPQVKLVTDKIDKDYKNILLIAGDIGHPTRPSYGKFIAYVSGLFDYVILIKGNHEYYCGLKSELNDLIKIIISPCPNVIFLDNNEVILFGLRVLGTTLWSKVDGNSIWALNDRKYCYKNADEANSMYERSVLWLRTKLQTINNPTVVLTHHLPSYKCIHEQYKSFCYNNMFASHLDDMIQKPITVWIHGHTHKQMNININCVHVVCNPIGYPGENTIQQDYNPILIEI